MRNFKLTLSVDRFSLRLLFSDYFRSLVRLDSGRPDIFARAVQVLCPLAAFAVSVSLGWKLSQASSLFGGVALLAGILLAGFSQVASFRLRVAERRQPTTERMSRMFREAISLILIAASVAILDAIVLGVTTALGGTKASVFLSSLVVAFSTLLVLLVVGTIRRLYTLYLEVFEGGLGLPSTKERKEQFERDQSQVAAEAELYEETEIQPPRVA